ncbi:MAG: hypothetical protein RRA15_07615 [bacterium]|nr:hypothetical protein [bacterium]MDT8366344.1 hypothetical protein [bacterium]
MPEPPFPYRLFSSFLTLIILSIGFSRLYLGALIWAVVMGTAGYLFGHAVEAVLGDLRNLEVVIVAVIAAVGGIIWNVYHVRSRQVRR